MEEVKVRGPLGWVSTFGGLGWADTWPTIAAPGAALQHWEFPYEPEIP